MTRIIAGTRRGRRIAVPAGDATRPTADRVREALFSAIASWAGTAAADPESSLRELAVADLYAGSGAVGLEAASRGAKPVLLVESSPRTGALIGRNIVELGLASAVSVRVERVERLVRGKPGRAYDVVFLDPPYGLGTLELADVLAGLARNGWLAPDGLLVVERSRRHAELSWPAGLEEAWRRDYGETTLIFATPSDAGGPADPVGE